MINRKAQTYNKEFAIAGFPCFADTLVPGGSLVFQMKLVLKLPAIAKP
jgi:hypothetical protein